MLQLQGNMLTTRAAAGTVQTMYGIAAIGFLARFYALLMNQNILVPAVWDGFPGNGVLDLIADAHLIDDLLRERRESITDFDNRH